MRPISFVFLFLLSLLVGCNPTGEKKSLCSDGQSFDPVTRACGGRRATATINTGGPVNTLTSASLTEDTAKYVYLTYRDPDSDLATSCSISSVVNLTAGACSCSSGVCSVNITPDSDETDSVNTASQGFSFLYTVTANSQTSTATWVTVSVAAVDDAPVITSLSPVAISLNEDASVMVTANFTDVDGGSHTYATFASSNLSITNFGCSAGTVGTCLFSITGASNFAGSASVNFRIASLLGVLYTYSNIQSLTGSFTAVNDVPVGTLSSATFTEDTESILTLTYTDVESDIADTGTGCTISATTNMAISTACACVAGVCTVGLTPAANLYTPTSGSIAFSYKITANTNTSTSTAVTLTNSNITVNAVADAPVGSTTTAAVTEDTQTNITLGYTDVDGDTATACSIRNYSNGSGSCSCSAGVCTLAFTPSTDVASPTAVTFNYSLTTGTGAGALSFTTAQSVTVNVAAVNDNPSITAATSLSGNMNTTMFQSLILDEGGGSDEDSQVLSGTGISFSSSNTTLVPNANCSVVLTDTTTAWADTALVSASSIPAYLKIIPANGQYGTATVTMTVTDGNGGSTSQAFLITVNPVYAIHNGWTNIKALGNKTDANGSILESRYVALYWEEFTIYGSSINTTTAYNVYRSTSASINFTTPINSAAIPSTQKYYIDTSSSLTAGTTYYYAVRPIDSVYSKPIAAVKMTNLTSGADANAAGAYGNLEIVMPDKNMALVHHWAVNKEICQKLGKTPPTVGVSVSSVNYDPDNDFRCQYTGPGDVNVGGVGYYDFGKHLHVDRFEIGCNYHQTDCTANGCIGYGNPTTTGCGGNACTPSTASISTPVLYYDRSSGTCYYSTSALSSAWVAASAMAITVMDDVSLNNAHLPPLTNISAAKAQAICVNRGATADRLMRRMDFVAASAWDTNLSDSSITNVEAGTNLATNTYCNSSALAGLSISADNSFPTSDTDTLPSTSSSSQRTLITGSSTTANCVSRYGIADLIGNVREWNSDSIAYINNLSMSAPTTSVIDTSFTNQWVENVYSTIFSFNSGSYGAYSGAANLTQWQYKNKSFNGNYFNVAYGVPTATNSAISMAQAIGTTITNSQLHEDFIAINAIATSGSGIGITTSGGSYSDGTQAGRYALEFLPSTQLDQKTGFRCVIEY